MQQIIIDNISTTYYITEDGKCYNTKTGKFLRGQINYKNGYISYSLTLPNGTKKRCYAHRLVGLAFIPNPHNKPQINHIDGNKLNNKIDNLEWVTAQENIKHSFEKELHSQKHIYCFSPDKRLVAEYKTIMEAAKAVNISYSLIQQEVNKQIKALSGGFYWSYDSFLGEIVEYTKSNKAKPVNQYTKKGKFITSYPSCGIAAKALGCNRSHIGECCRGKIKSYKGYIWRYVEDIVSPSSES